MMACWLRLCVGAWIALAAFSVAAVERVSVCFNYGCLAQAEVEFSDEQLDEVGQWLAAARNSLEERRIIGEAVGRLLAWAGQQSPIAADRGGNYADDAVYGRMDCIDHSTTTTRLLQLMERHGWLRFHRVLAPALRSRFLVFEHYSAQIEEISVNSAEIDGALFVVDSWFFDNGRPAAVMPLAAWLNGESPNVE